jgi:hypothetical protein
MTMSDRSAIKRVFGTALTVLLIGLLFAPVAQAKDVPIYIEYTGTGHDLLHPGFGDLTPDNIVLADAKGSFGAKSTAIVVNFGAPPAIDDPCKAGYTFLGIEYARAVTSFKDGSQLFATVIPGAGSYMCVNFDTGHYYGIATGVFIGGNGRFEGASGPFESPFDGYNLTSAAMGEYPFRSIKGWFDGTVIFD